MIYYFLYELLYNHFKDKDWFLVKALNVFQYVTFRTAYATITALLISLFFGGKLIEALKMERRPADSRRRSAGPQGQARHADDGRRADSRLGIDLNFAVGATVERLRLDGVIATLLFAAIGFADDYSKMAKQRSLGLDRQAKVAGAVADRSRCLGGAFISTKYLRQRLFVERQHSVFEIHGGSDRQEFHRSLSLSGLDRRRVAGIVKRSELDRRFGRPGDQRHLHRDDRVDGFTYLSSDARWARYLELTHRPEAAELTVFCGAMAGASLGFLWYNAPPAEVFMGDVGSLAIGGAMGTVAVLTKQEFMLLMVGGVFVIEAMSVMLQVGVFKMTKRTTGTGRRLFKMTPLHHHFEMQDWKESKIVFRFLILAILFALLSLSTLKLQVGVAVVSGQWPA